MRYVRMPPMDNYMLAYPISLRTMYTNEGNEKLEEPPDQRDINVPCN